MDAPSLSAMTDRMAAFPGALSALLAPVSDVDARLKPPSGAWSIVEIVNHLADEEDEDFRTRVRMTLEDPSQAWPGIDPEGAAIERRYNDRALGESLDRFASARAASVAWLRSLERPDWSRTHRHPKIGDLRAGDVLLSWCAHDALHLRQLAKRVYELALQDGAGYRADYAGGW
ncbi:MAG: DinB family protein [Phycisphaeraceae bacterium]|nr:DinB family protein [Phycisphaeraceae bacterium]MCB9848708.1 DinB family protein [Phycisphaeraceae bacterium]